MNPAEKHGCGFYCFAALLKLSARVLAGFVTAVLALLWLLITAMVVANDSELDRQILANWAVATPLALPVLRCGWAEVLSGRFPARRPLLPFSGPWAFAFATAMGLFCFAVHSGIYFEWRPLDAPRSPTCHSDKEDQLC